MSYEFFIKTNFQLTVIEQANRAIHSMINSEAWQEAVTIEARHRAETSRACRKLRGVAMTQRQRLPNRRACQTFEIWHQGLGFTACVGFYPSGRLDEIFLSSNKPGSAVESVARDAAIVTSLALQFGADLETIQQALTKDSHGKSATLLGAALEPIEETRS